MPYWRLSTFYLFFFGSLGALIPYWSLYLKSLGFTPSDIGELMAVIMATKIIAPNIWGWIADHTGRRVTIIRLATFVALIAFSAVFLAQGFWWVALVMCLFSFFWNAALPQFEATTFSYLGDDVHKYSSIRLWGSVGFIVAVVAVGAVLDSRGTEVIPMVICLLLLGLWLSSLLVPKGSEKPVDHHHESIWVILRRPEVMMMFVVCFLLQASHGPYYTFYTIYLEDHDYSRSVIGQLWALGVLAEIGVFLVMHRLLPRFGVRALLLWSLALTTLRWLLVAWFVEWAPIMIFAQILHAASFGVYHAVAIHLIHKFFVGRHQGRGQALYSSLSFGAGGAVGSLMSGYVWSGVGPSASYLVAAAFSLVAFVLAWQGIRSSHV